MTSIGSSSLTAVADELIGQLSGAAKPEELPWGAGATFDTVVVTRQPLLLARINRDLTDETLTVTVTADGVAQPVLTFAPWSERGSQLVAFVPATDPDGASPAFSGTVSATRTDRQGTTVPLAPADVTSTIMLELVQGVLGKLMAVVLGEKQRLRRQARELRAMRALQYAKRSALDRIGIDLGVPRLADSLAWDPATKQIATAPLPNNRETDDAYRSRLRIFRGMRLATPAWIDTMANGPGAASDPNAGWLADLRFAQRVAVDETPNPLHIAFRLVACGRPKARAQLLEAIRHTFLVWPAGSFLGNVAHDGRMIPPATATRVDAARTALAALNLPTTQPVAPSLAFALQRLHELQSRLGVAPFKAILAGQHDAGGSRYELGFGAQLAAPAAADLTTAVTAAAALDEPSVGASSVADDPIGAWLLRACGLRTVTELADGTIYVSTISSGGLVIDVAPSPDGKPPLSITARLEGANDPSLDQPLHGVVAALAADGLSPVADPSSLFAGIQGTANNAALAAALAILDLPRVTSVADVSSRLAKVASRDYVVFELNAATTSQVVGDPSKLADFVNHGERGGASSVLPLLTAAGTLALVFGIVDLPLAGNNLAAHHTIAYRWQVRGLIGHPVDVQPKRGPAVTVGTAGDGISVVACLAYVRTGGNDPYEWRPTLPAGVLLDLAQYEHLMNIVELATPLGIRADTWTIRRRHVDVDGSGKPTPLSPSAARTYHRYRPMHP